MDFLPTLWFILIAVLWIGYLVLDGFDLGVGMLLKGWARNESQRRVILNTIGPVWDGNEVWLITAAGATFAAFPHWYASMFAGLYIPLTIALLALILRAVSIEYAGSLIANEPATRGTGVWPVARFLQRFQSAPCLRSRPLGYHSMNTATESAGHLHGSAVGLWSVDWQLWESP